MVQASVKNEHSLLDQKASVLAVVFHAVGSVQQFRVFVIDEHGKILNSSLAAFRLSNHRRR